MAHSPHIPLRPDIVRHVRRGHPWVWKDALARTPSLPPGTPVTLVDPHGAFVAHGLVDPHSPLAIRIWTRNPDEPVDADLVRTRLLAAAQRRRPLFDPLATDAFRIAHGEADALPGIVVDRYADTAVVRFDGDAPASFRDVVLDTLLLLDGLRTVVERSGRRASPIGPSSIDRPGGLAASALPPSASGSGVYASPLQDEENGAAPRRLIRENHLLFEVDVLHGHKTGLYLDQRDNRARIRSLAAGRRVLNLFAYTGGFAVAAAAGGAVESLSLDIAAPAIEAARRNLARNGADPARHRAETADVRRALRTSDLARTRWDLIVLDPPSFAPNRAALPKALLAYRRLNTAALRLARPGTLLLTCSCSSHVDRRTFLRMLRDAAGDARVRLGRPILHGAPADHPSLPGFPEGDYLKAALVEVLQ